MYTVTKSKTKLTIKNCIFKKGRVLFTTHDSSNNKTEALDYTMYDFVEFLEWCVRSKKYLRIDDENVRTLMIRVEAEVKARTELKKEMFELSKLDTSNNATRTSIKKIGFNRVSDTFEYETYVRDNTDVYLNFSEKLYSARDNVNNTHVKIPNDIMEVLNAEGFRPTLMYKNIVGAKK